MVDCRYKKDRSNVPILSKCEIDTIAEKYVMDFMPEIIEQPQEFNVEGFIECYLNLNIDYQYLSNDGRYLGMTVFNDTDSVIIYRPEDNCADYLHADSGTIIIDNSLLNKKQEHRYRFTLGHESGHWIFHREHYGYNRNQIVLFETNDAFIQCRETNKNYLNCIKKNWDDSRWMEWQADKFSAGVLMPMTSVQNLLKLNEHNVVYPTDEDYAVRLLSEVFNVSKQASYFRLCDLGYIQPAQDVFGYRQLNLL